jgi:methylated-DNA-[protein]-cysteine S-methyltransferase
MSRSRADYSLVLASPLGRLGIRLEGEAVCRLDYLPGSTALKPARSRSARRISRELAQYFADSAYRIGVPLKLSGTPFQRRVWSALQTIPPGETSTYAEVASQLGSGARAVGNACRRNPVSVIVPCHRVVAASGMGGYSGRTSDRAIWRKHWLLSHEGATCRGLKTRRPAPTVTI